MKTARLVISLALVAAVVLFILFVPLPHRVWCTLEVKPRDAESVYVPVAGAIAEVLVKPGDVVKQGQPVARLKNVDLELKVAELDGHCREYEGRLLGLRDQQFRDSKASLEIPQVQETLATYQETLREKQADLEKLLLLAPTSGTVIPPPYQPSQPDPDGKLSMWFGTPFDTRNVGAFLTEGTLFCQIGDPQKMEAILVIDQADVDFVRQDQAADIKLDELPSETYTSHIEEISHLDLKVSPRGLSNKSGGALATKTDASGAERLMNTSYQARAPLADTDEPLRPGLRGQANIHVGWQSLGSRFWRYITRTFNFRM